MLATLNRFLTLSRPPLPGQPEGFSRSDAKRLPARGSILNRSCKAAQVLSSHPDNRDGSPEGHFMERRNDILLSSLRKAVEAMGGELIITARFPNMEVCLNNG